MKTTNLDDIYGSAPLDWDRIEDRPRAHRGVQRAVGGSAPVVRVPPGAQPGNGGGHRRALRSDALALLTRRPSPSPAHPEAEVLDDARQQRLTPSGSVEGSASQALADHATTRARSFRTTQPRRPGQEGHPRA